MQNLHKHFYEFGLFRIDTAERQIFRDGQAVPLTPKVFDLLLFLVENRGRTLAKDELMERVWAGTFVEENNLSRNISMLRKVLGDDLHDSRFIKTIPKRGYRFEPEVREFLEEEEETVVEKRTRYSFALRGKSATARPRFFRHALAMAGLVVLSVAAFLWIVGKVQRNEATQTFIETPNAEALSLYQRGRELWRNRSASGLHEATLLLEQAVEHDPNFALVHAALADSYAFDTGNWKRTAETATRAMALDPTLGEPHASIGFVKLFWEWKPAEAEAHFRKSLALSPGYPTAHQWYAVFLTIDGQFNESLAEIDRAIELDPNSLAAQADRCQVLYFLQRYDDAAAQCEKALESDGKFFAAHLHLYDIYTAQGRYNKAIEIFFKTEQLSVNHSTLPEQLRPLKEAYDNGGIRSFWHARIESIDKPKGSGGYLVAKYYAQLGETDKALGALCNSYQKRDFDFPFFWAEPVFLKCCVNDPRYRELRNLWSASQE